MILAVFLAALLLLFIVVRHNVGVPFLAMIAGVAVYENWGASFANLVSEWVPEVQAYWVQYALYGLLVVVFPLILYLRAGKSGLFGVLRIIVSAIFAIVLTIMVAEPLANIFSFDNLSYEIAGFLNSIRGIAMVAGISAAYVDVFLFHSGKTW
ncbi:MAG: hypothetical protein MJ154_02980 [Candidatus Saccharibacteria bacterium]|nr:hypothetical protein [Candidatus Saccharibacteria bacterium]